MNEKTLKELIAEMDRIEGNTTVDEAVMGPSSLTTDLLIMLADKLAAGDRTRSSNQRGVPTKVETIQRQIAQHEAEAKRIMDAATAENVNQAWNEATKHHDKIVELEKEAIDAGVEMLANVRTDRPGPDSSVDPQTASDQGAFLSDLERQINN